MATRYKKFLQLCEMWPVDAGKPGRDLGAYIRQQVGESFKLGEASAVPDPVKCDAYYASLRRLATNYHGSKFHRARVTGATGLPAEKVSAIMTTNIIEMANEKGPGIFKRAVNFVLRRDQ
ncbi:putative Ubiquinol-cytochrome-c reductase complex assembly factor 2 [Hypsibius exemplaris]|uniref:Mitochondrial nucleoid factor 1 n=1 Tax=Hypsibius exemplaris TaxID=2072580 RepID=A0A1W0X197_HYPEX|nr:putative Ubiquinol-cytochrome-c reductase complex assembly factor 2 [Hypsibius exemplaris]